MGFLFFFLQRISGIFLMLTLSLLLLGEVKCIVGNLAVPSSDESPACGLGRDKYTSEGTLREKTWQSE